MEKVQGGDVEPTYVVTRNADAERMASEAKSIGVNVNQIARALNAETKSHPGSLSPGVLGECKTGLEEVRGELSKLTDEVDGLRTDFGKDVFRVEMGSWQRGDVDGYEVSIPGTAGSARGTFVDMGNPHVVAVIEDAFASLPTVEELDLVAKPVVSPEIPTDQNVEFVRIDEQSEGDDEGEATMRVNERGCGETLSCGTGLCATAITLRSKTGIDHWTITVRGGTLRVDVTDDDVTLTGSATIVGKVELL